MLNIFLLQILSRCGTHLLPLDVLVSEALLSYRNHTRSDIVAALNILEAKGLCVTTTDTLTGSHSYQITQTGLSELRARGL